MTDKKIKKFFGSIGNFYHYRLLVNLSGKHFGWNGMCLCGCVCVIVGDSCVAWGWFGVAQSFFRDSWYYWVWLVRVCDRSPLPNCWIPIPCPM